MPSSLRIPEIMLRIVRACIAIYSASLVDDFICAGSRSRKSSTRLINNSTLSSLRTSLPFTNSMIRRPVYISVSPARQKRHSRLSVKTALPYRSASILIWERARLSIPPTFLTSTPANGSVSVTSSSLCHSLISIFSPV